MNKRRKGFTLIELMIVMAMIAVLSSMLLPNFLKVQDKAKETAVKSVMHALQTAVESYSIDTGAYPTGTNIDVASLYAMLSENGYLKSMPQNPFTGKTYTASDETGTIAYTYNSTSGVYTLEGFGRDSEKVILTLQNS